MSEAENRAKLHGKLSKVMGRLSKLPKDGTNQHFGYKYVTDAAVADAVRGALAAEGVSFLASIKEVTQELVKNEKDKLKSRTVVLFEFTFGCSETGAEYTCTWAGEAEDGQDKGIAKAATAAEKYFFLKTFVLSTGDVADPDAGGSNDDKMTALDAFRKRVLAEIPYYNHVNHINATLKQMGYEGYNPDNEDAMWADLQTHASEKADDEAGGDK